MSTLQQQERKPVDIPKLLRLASDKRMHGRSCILYIKINKDVPFEVVKKGLPPGVNLLAIVGRVVMAEILDFRAEDYK